VWVGLNGLIKRMQWPSLLRVVMNLRVPHNTPGYPLLKISVM
jgi:hypothetical protein